jgi:insertion element IS1 protein InsB
MAIVREYTCRDCGSKNIVKNGKSKYGQQKYHCKDCNAYKVLEPKQKYTEERKDEIIRAYQERSSMRGIQRIYGTCRKTLSGWLKKNQKNRALLTH